MRLWAPVDFCSFLVSALFVFTITPASVGQPYGMKIVERSAFENAINSSGQIVGVINRRHPSGAFLWTKTTGIQDLGSISGTSDATAINNSGQVVGSFGTVGDEQAFIWTQATGMQALGFYGNPSGISDGGQIAGYYNDASPLAFFWSQATGFQDLGTLGGCCSQATGINDSGQVVGWSYTTSGETHPFFWTLSAGMQDLGFIGEALGINNVGQVVGSYSNGGTASAFLWTQTTGLQDLGIDQGYASSASAINDNGQVVGFAVGPTDYAFLWSAAAGVQNLNELTSGQVAGFREAGSSTINNAGQIATDSELLAGNEAAVLFTPIISVSLASSPNPSEVGQEFTITATATSIAGSPPNGENIEFYEGRTLLATVPMGGGIAQFSDSGSKPGKLRISAVYPGDVNYDPSKPSAIIQVVNK